MSERLQYKSVYLKSYTKTEDSINHVQQNTERGLLWCKPLQDSVYLLFHPFKFPLHNYFIYRGFVAKNENRTLANIIMETLFVFFECTIVNLATYKQFTNAAWDWIIKKKNKKTKQKENKQTNKNKTKQNKIPPPKKKIKIALSLAYPSSCFYNKRCNMLL